MTTLALDLITDAAVISGTVGLSEPLSAEVTAFALRQLNNLIESLGLQPYACYDSREDTITLTGGVAVYSTALLNQRPPSIDYVTVVGSGVTYPLELIGDQEYANISYKSSGGIPDRVNFFINWPDSLLRYYPTPIAGYTSIVAYPGKVQNFTSVATAADWPPGYLDAITYQLALRMYAGRPPAADVMQRAADLLANVKRPNTPIIRMSSGVHVGAGRGGRFNIYNGENE